jgi:hypothetical protein
MDLDSIVAEWYLGLYPPEKMPILAAWALEQGLDGAALRELAGRTNATYSDERGLIERALRELGKEALDLSSAGRLLGTLLCQKIVSGSTSPHDGASRIWAIYNRCGMPKSLIPFVGFASEWEDDPDHRNHYDNLIVEAARKLLGYPSQTASVRFFLTEKEFEEAIIVRKSWQINPFYRVAGRVVCGCGAIFFLGLVWWRGKTWSHLFSTDPVTAGGLLLFAAFELCIALGLHEAKVWNRLINRFDQEREITVEEDNVKITRGPKTWTKKWKEFAGFYESPSMFVLQTRGAQFWTVPKRAFEPGVEPIFCHLLESKLRRK